MNEMIMSRLIRIFPSYLTWEDEVTDYSHWIPLPNPPDDT